MLKTGINAIINIFGDFLQKIAFLLKTNVVIIFSASIAAIGVNTAKFFGGNHFN
jgi:hypothetical protein